MVNGPPVRVIPTSPLARALDLSPETLGTVLCCYRSCCKTGGPVERVDVRFSEREIVWGGAADQFEVVDAAEHGRA